LGHLSWGTFLGHLSWGQESVSFHVVGSKGDIFEPNQVVKARERLGDHGLDIRMVPGGHMTTSEQPEQLARIIEEVRPPSG
jgi:surfactin synthase thioesterase subunit